MKVVTILLPHQFPLCVLQQCKGKCKITNQFQIHEVKYIKLNEELNMWVLLKTEIAHLLGDGAL